MEILIKLILLVILMPVFVLMLPVLLPLGIVFGVVLLPMAALGLIGLVLFTAFRIVLGIGFFFLGLVMFMLCAVVF